MVKIGKFLVFIIVIIGFFSWGTSYFLGPVDINKNTAINITIPDNTSVAKIGDILEKANLIHNKDIFKIYVRYKQPEVQLKAGSYELSPSMSLEEIIAVLQKGSQERLMFTIPEGFTVKQIAKALQDKGIADYDEFLAVTTTKRFPYPYLNYNKPKVNNPLEGYLFPDTYYIPKNFSEEAIVSMMLKRFDEVLDEKMRGQAEELKLSIPEVVTMASLVEKEARIAEERPIIAGVFYNRLGKNIRLESCATVQYLLGKAKPILLYEDLKIESPYNTYRNAGLPPGPIASPGKASLMAAVNPTKSDYLFFVAKEDGSHYFSKTLSEHNKAKRKFLP